MHLGGMVLCIMLFGNLFELADGVIMIQLVSSTIGYFIGKL